MTNQVLALLGGQLLAFPKGVDVDVVIDICTPAGRELELSHRPGPVHTAYCILTCNTTEKENSNYHTDQALCILHTNL